MNVIFQQLRVNPSFGRIEDLKGKKWILFNNSKSVRIWRIKRIEVFDVILGVVQELQLEIEMIW
jgi:hypothetical protein